MTLYCGPCYCSTSSGIQSRPGSLLCTAINALQKQNSRCHCSTVQGAMPPTRLRDTVSPSPHDNIRFVIAECSDSILYTINHLIYTVYMRRAGSESSGSFCECLHITLWCKTDTGKLQPLSVRGVIYGALKLKNEFSSQCEQLWPRSKRGDTFHCLFIIFSVYCSIAAAAAYQLDPAPRTRCSSFQPPHMGSPGPDGVCFALQPWENTNSSHLLIEEL